MYNSKKKKMLMQRALISHGLKKGLANVGCIDFINDGLLHIWICRKPFIYSNSSWTKG